MREFLLDQDGFPTPSCHAAIIGGVVSRIALAQKPMAWDELLHPVLKDIGITEEQGRATIFDILCILTNGGLVECDAWDPVTQTMTITDYTTVSPSGALKLYVWGENDDDELPY